MVTNIRSWLRRPPHPAKLLCDDETEVAMGSGKRRWSEAEQAILALQPQRVSALDESGAILRVMVLDPALRGHIEERTDHGRTVTEDADVESLPATELVQLGQLLVRSADSAAERHADAYKYAFDKMAQIVELAFTRLGALEQAWQEAMAEKAEMAEGAGDSDLSRAIETMVATRSAVPPSQAQRRNGKREQRDE